jgi:hypothetical protein
MSAASRRIGTALLQEDLEGRWKEIGKLVQDIETIKTLGEKGEDSHLQPLVLLLHMTLMASRGFSGTEFREFVQVLHRGSSVSIQPRDQCGTLN